MAIQRRGRRSSSEVLSTRFGTTSSVFQVQVGLVETVEEHQPVCTGLHQTMGEVGQGGEEGAQLDRQGDLDLARTSLTSSM